MIVVVILFILVMESWDVGCVSEEAAVQNIDTMFSLETWISFRYAAVLFIVSKKKENEV